MLQNKSFLAVIPARGGSKRLPKKNILELGDKPLIAWTIDAALKSEFIDHVLVTSDDDEILKIADAYGSDILRRPPALAKDDSTTIEVVEHVIEHTRPFDYVVLLQPTSPLRTFHHVDDAIRLLIDRKARAVISVCEMEHSPLWANVLASTDSMSEFLSEVVLNARSQDLPVYYRINGAIYICCTERLVMNRTFFIPDDIYAFKMDRLNSVDIDVELDFKWAEFLMKHHSL